MCYLFFFFFNDTPTTEIYTLSLHDALPISQFVAHGALHLLRGHAAQKLIGELDHHAPLDLPDTRVFHPRVRAARSEEHTSELQSRRDLVCRLLLEKKKKQKKNEQ